MTYLQFIIGRYLLPAVLHPEEIWGPSFQLTVWSMFLNTNKNVLIYIILHTFSHFFLVVQNVLLNRTQGSSLFT